MNKKALVLLGLAGLLAGCVTMTPEERRAADERTCLGYGFKPRLDLDRRADRRAWENRVDFYDRPIMLYQPIYRPVVVRPR
jgi:hypothetical protein